MSKLNTATVGDIIDYLKKNFNNTDKICYMDCVEGLKNDCTYVTKDKLGKRFFRYVNKDEVNEEICSNDVVLI